MKYICTIILSTAGLLFFQLPAWSICPNLPYICYQLYENGKQKGYVLIGKYCRGSHYTTSAPECTINNAENLLATCRQKHTKISNFNSYAVQYYNGATWFFGWFASSIQTRKDNNAYTIYDGNVTWPSIPCIIN